MTRHALTSSEQQRSDIRRHCTALVRWVLLWFVLSLGAAIAAPVIHPQVIELACSANGSVKAIVHTDDGAAELGASHADCPLCLMAGASPATESAEWPLRPPLAHALRPPADTHVVESAAAPLPARGPPSRH